MLDKLSVTVDSDDETLRRSTDVSYTIAITAGSTATVHAATIFGAMYGLETFSQLAVESSLTEDLQLKDAPMFPHRGLMVDAGRRFLPITLLQVEFP